jgi:hypothetical protein
MSDMPTKILPTAVAAALMLCGCDSSGRGSSSGGGAGGDPSGAPLPDNLTEPLNPEEVARLRSRAETALAVLVPNAASARYAHLRNGAGGAICGEVEAAGGGVLFPFLVTPDGAAIVSRSPAIRLDDADDPFPDLYMQYCATVEELGRLGAQMNALVPSPAQAPEFDPLPPSDTGEVGAYESPADDVEEPRRGDDESFFNVVVRAPQSAAPRR